MVRYEVWRATSYSFWIRRESLNKGLAPLLCGGIVSVDEYRPEDDDTPCIYPDWDYYHTQTGVVVLAARMDSLFKILTGEHNWSYWARGIAGDYIVQFADGTTLVFPARIFHALFVLTEAL